jgi:septal ring factor EnvC (AmiA/AmiB activator)
MPKKKNNGSAIPELPQDILQKLDMFQKQQIEALNKIAENEKETKKALTTQQVLQKQLNRQDEILLGLPDDIESITARKKTEKQIRTIESKIKSLYMEKSELSHTTSELPEQIRMTENILGLSHWISCQEKLVSVYSESLKSMDSEPYAESLRELKMYIQSGSNTNFGNIDYMTRIVTDQGDLKDYKDIGV